jgi:hypothetical protein
MAANRSDDLFEMVNLEPDQTGVPGTVTIMTRHARHEPHVRWYEARPGEATPYLAVSIEAEPQAMVSEGVPGHLIAMAGGDLIAWVRLNHEKLQRFWRDGASWYEREIETFVFSLTKLPRQPKESTDLPVAENPY